jgi:predicted DNA-binding transcriptional regulator YafY
VTAPATRLLMLLEILQDRPIATGRELAERLEVDVRTVRRYAVALQELGIPVEGERGPAGGYRIRPGYKLPPLMLTDEEASAVVLGLLAAQRYGLGAGTAVEGALAKLRRVLPAALAAQVSGLEETLGFTHAVDAVAAPPLGETVLRLADAARRRRRVHVRYTSHGGEESARELSPFGLVFHAGRWYLAAHDHTREALRTFRVDRVGSLRLGGAADPPPDGVDAVAHVSSSLARVPWTWAVEVLLYGEYAHAREQIPPTLGELTEQHAGAGVLLRMRVESLDYMAALLARLDVPFTVRSPDELRSAVGALAERLQASARRR